MADPSGIEAATKRLSLAIDALGAAIERRRQGDRAEQKLTEQLHVLGADRSRLAAELDLAAGRSRRLEEANREIARRLDSAIDTIRAVVDAPEA